MNVAKWLNKESLLKELMEENFNEFTKHEEARADAEGTKLEEINERCEALLEEYAKLDEEMDKVKELIKSLIITSPEEPHGVTVAETHYDSKVGGYKPSLGTALIKDEEGNLVEVKLRPDNLIRSQWADNFIEGHKYKWKGRPVRKRPFHNVDTEWVCFVTHIEEVIE